MAKRTDATDLKECLATGAIPPVLHPSAARLASENPGVWHRLANEKNAYGSVNSARTSSAIFRRKLGAGYRVKAIDTQVYVVFDGVPVVQGVTVLEASA